MPCKPSCASSRLVFGRRESSRERVLAPCARFGGEGAADVQSISSAHPQL